MPASICSRPCRRTARATATRWRTRAKRSGFQSPTTTTGPIFSARYWRRGSSRNWDWNGPRILYEYPRCEAALARASRGDPRVAERFELYACGVELANGFGELTEPDEQRARFVAEMDEKQRVYGERYPLDEDFLAALARMPPASGVALGFDRLVMLAAGAPDIDHVIWTPLE